MAGSKWQKKGEEKEAKSQYMNQSDDTAFLSMPQIGILPRVSSQSTLIPFQTPPNPLSTENISSLSPSQEPFPMITPINPSAPSSCTPTLCESAGENTQKTEIVAPALLKIITGAIWKKSSHKARHRARLSPSPSTSSSSLDTSFRRERQRRKRHNTREMQTVRMKRKGRSSAIAIPNKEELTTDNSLDISREYSSTADMESEDENQEANNPKEPLEETKWLLHNETTFMQNECVIRERGITIEEIEEFVVVDLQYESKPVHIQCKELEEQDCVDISITNEQ